jgi:hypothetical protein
MKKIILTTLVLCSCVFGEIVLNENIKQFELYDQFDKKHTILPETKGLIFAFTKPSGHQVKDFLAKQKKDYLSSRGIYYVADVSAMPSIIRWFVLDNLDKYEYEILLIEDEEISSEYKDEKNIEKIMYVALDNMKVTSIKYFEEMKGLQKLLEEK